MFLKFIDLDPLVLTDKTAKVNDIIDNVTVFSLFHLFYKLLTFILLQTNIKPLIKSANPLRDLCKHHIRTTTKLIHLQL